METKKIKLGQFFTKETMWLKPQVIEFIKNSKCKIAYDPFAGGGDLLKTATNILNIKEIKGLDIDASLQWEVNDSLVDIPHIDDAIIITNPPYIAKQSATRKKIDLSQYFSVSTYDDVYLIALDKMLEAQKKVVAIIPESFINSLYRQKSKIYSITILEENPFKDTENPVCVVCFDGVDKNYDQIIVYKNDKLINNLQNILNIRIQPEYFTKIVFNTLEGWLGLRAIDSADDKTYINFDYKENFDYDWERNIKVSSRHLSLIQIDVPKDKRDEFIFRCNKLIKQIRKDSSDILLTPFKGNTKHGVRRRRLDFRLARAIMEIAFKDICGGSVMNNKDYFEYSQKNDDDFIDFSKPEGFLVINKDANDKMTDLMIANHLLTDLITTYKTLKNNKYTSKNKCLNETLDKIIDIIKNTKYINYSAFCIYFQVVGYSYSSFLNNKKNIKKQDERKIIENLLDLYIKNRHDIYLYHGYSDQVLQVNSDAASSRRKGLTGIEKMESVLKKYNFVRAKDIKIFKQKSLSYILPDKGDKSIFNNFLQDEKINFNYHKENQNKYPDILLKINNDYYIIEHKLTNDAGGSQNLEINEIIKFIQQTENRTDIHYISCLQGNYFQKLNSSKNFNRNKNKTNTQYNDIIKALDDYTNNYFINGKGFEKLIENLK